MENISSCVYCLRNIVYEKKIDIVKEGDSTVYIEYFICPNCGMKNIIEIYRNSDLFYNE